MDVTSIRHWFVLIFGPRRTSITRLRSGSGRPGFSGSGSLGWKGYDKSSTRRTTWILDSMFQNPCCYSMFQNSCSNDRIWGILGIFHILSSKKVVGAMVHWVWWFAYEKQGDILHSYLKLTEGNNNNGDFKPSWSVQNLDEFGILPIFPFVEGCLHFPYSIYSRITAVWYFIWQTFIRFRKSNSTEGIYGAYGMYMGCIWDVYGMYMGCIWDVYGMYMGCIWDVYGMYMGCIWDVYGMYMGCIWDVYGMYMGCIWDVYGMYMGCVWDVYGMYMGCIWDVYGMCMGCIWDVYGMYMGCIWDVYGMYMGCIWDVYGMYMGCIWDVYGMYMGCVWDVYGMYMGCTWDVYMGCIWDVHGMYMGCIWDVYGMYMGCIWDVYGMYMGCIWDVYGMYMGCIWDVYGMCMGCIWDVGEWVKNHDVFIWDDDHQIHDRHRTEVRGLRSMTIWPRETWKAGPCWPTREVIFVMWAMVHRDL